MTAWKESDKWEHGDVFSFWPGMGHHDDTAGLRFQRVGASGSLAILAQARPSTAPRLRQLQKQREVRPRAERWRAGCELNDRGHLPSPVETE